MLLQDKTALITGASRGIGRAIAIQFAKEGCKIAFTFNSNEQAANDVVNAITELGGICKAYKSNAADYDNAHQIVEQVLQDFGNIDILVNNAGITQVDMLLRMTEEKYDRVMDTNLKSVFSYTHAVAQHMMRQRKGSIISVSSTVGLVGGAGQTAYAASKAGVVALMKSVAKEMGARGIRANAIAPGFIRTDMTSSIPETVQEEIRRRIPLQREGLPEEVAKVALFLASDLASYVSGQVITVNGAMD